MAAPARRAPAPRLRLVEESKGRRGMRPYPVIVTVVMVIALVAVAVGFKAQQVSAQAQLDRTRDAMVEATERQQDLRARVAEVESPARVLEAAEDLGMIEPAPVVAVPAPGVASPEPDGLAG